MLIGTKSFVKPSAQPAPAKPPSTMMETMLRSMGGGEIINAAKKLAESGSLEKFLQFVEHANEFTERLERIEKLLLASLARGTSDQSSGSNGATNLALDDGHKTDLRMDREAGTGTNGD